MIEFKKQVSRDDEVYVSFKNDVGEFEDNEVIFFPNILEVYSTKSY